MSDKFFLPEPLSFWHAYAVSALAYLRYLVNRLHFPQADLALREGFGIEERARRCSTYWSSHLENTRTFISDRLLEIAPSSITILGAGRLFDFPLDRLPDSIREVTFVDIDPSCKPTWHRHGRSLRKNGISTQEVLGDCTGRFSLLRDAARANTQAPFTSILATAASAPPIRPNIPPADVVLSLNLLSQLGIGLQRELNSLLNSHRTHAATRAEALSHQAKQLAFQIEFEHLELISTLAHQAAIIVCDIEFIDYYADEPQWRSLPALELPLPFSCPGFDLTREKSWLWHLAPLGLEYLDHGEIHRVHASCWRKRDA